MSWALKLVYSLGADARNNHEQKSLYCEMENRCQANREGRHDVTDSGILVGAIAF